MTEPNPTTAYTDFPPLARRLIYAAIFTGSGALLLGLPPPYSSVVLLALLLGALVLWLYRSGFPPLQVLKSAARVVWESLLLVFGPLIVIVGVFVRFNRDSRPAPTARRTGAHRLKLPPVVEGALSLALLVGALLLPGAFDESPAVGAFLALLVAAIVITTRALGADALAAPRGAWRALAAAFTEDRAELENIPRRRVALELLVVLVITLIATRRFFEAGPPLQYSGNEAEWLTSSIYAAYYGLRDYGRIPLWQPLLEFGEPLVENPFSFILNPFSAGLSLLIGPAQGLKFTVPLLTLLAGVGGWFMGWTLGLAWPGRVLLGLLLVGKGNMHAMFNTGYFQLATQQVYFPWITGGTMAIFRLPGRRWPVALTALAFTLMYTSGNLWYVLPMLVALAVLAAVYAWPAGAARRFPQPDWAALRRLALAGALTLGLSAVLLLPMAINWGRVGSHPPEVRAGWEVSVWRAALPFYFDPNPHFAFEVYSPKFDLKRPYLMDALEEFYYSFVSPAWFAALIAVGMPLYRARHTRARRFWWAAWGLVIVFTLWGAGGHPLFVWLYENIPALQGWRFVGRALAAASFFLAALIAMRVDNLWRSLTETDWRRYLPERPRWAGALPVLLAGGLLVGAGAAGWQVTARWNIGYQDILNPIHPDDECVSWLRRQRPHDELAVWRFGYRAIITYMNNRVRASQIYADFEMTPLPSTLGRVNLTASLPEYGIAWAGGEHAYLLDRGYAVLPDSPIVEQSGKPCLYRKNNALSYVYTVPLSVVLTAEPGGDIVDEFFLLEEHKLLPPDAITLPPEKTTPVTDFVRQPDSIWLRAAVEPGRFMVVTAQERAYPGWEVTVNGQPAKLESVGGQIGVVLPREGGEFFVHFVYRPPWLFRGAAVTLLTSAFCAAWLLRLDRRLRRKRA
ncbi:MAG: hypothetical protein BroJett038_26900 [Chloroflexota bacterium]|nr:MAG: hypothetical protein BroJett038_26900 [Chloroflexota bacterium]